MGVPDAHHVLIDEPFFLGYLPRSTFRFPDQAGQFITGNGPGSLMSKSSRQLSGSTFGNTLWDAVSNQLATVILHSVETRYIESNCVLDVLL